MSMRPGRIVLFPRSIFLASAGAGSPRPPTALMRPSVTTIWGCSTSRPARTSTMRAPVTTIVSAGDCGARQTDASAAASRAVLRMATPGKKDCRFQLRRDHRHEKIAFAYQSADLLVPRVSSIEPALVVPDLESVRPQSVPQEHRGRRAWRVGGLGVGHGVRGSVG